MLNLVFIVDPLELFHFKKDTSYILMLAAQLRGHNILVVEENGLCWHEQQLVFQGRTVEFSDNVDRPFRVIANESWQSKNVDFAVMRLDPPFDERYVNITWLLDLAKVKMLNSTHGLRTVNEKIWAAQFTQFVPDTCFTSTKKDFDAFVDQHKTIVAKPSNGFGGVGIFIISAEDTNRAVIFETLSENGKKYIILQQYIPQAEQGDKRILLLNGEVLGAVLRQHSDGEHRNNFASGGTAVHTSITENEHKIVAALKPKLIELDLNFVGIDVIGDKLIEVNVTSPTCMQEMNEFLGHRRGQGLEQKVVESWERYKS